MTARILPVALLVVMLGALVACGNSSSSDPVVRGRQVYDKEGCSSCHSINGQGGTTGPEHTHIATEAAERIKDPNYKGQATDAAGYIRESIVTPSAYVVPNYPDHVMPATFGQQLSPQELDDLVTYLMTLK